MRDYGKVHTSFWTSSNIHALSDDGRTLALYLLTCPHGTIAGVFRLPDGYACEDLQWDAQRVKTTLTELFQNGFATRCEDTKWVWVIKHFEWNPPENPNQRKSAAKMAAQVPDSCSWKVDFIEKCGIHFNFEGQKTEPFGNPSATLPEPVTVTVTGDKTPSSAAKLPTCPFEAVVNAYNEILPEMAGVKVIDEDRKRSIKKRWDWVLSSKKPDGSRRAETGDEAIEWFKKYFQVARDNDFLMGRTPKSGDHQNWKCDIEFLMSSKGIKQVIEKTEATQ